MDGWDFNDVTERFAAIADRLGEIPASRAQTGSKRMGFAVATLTLAMEHFDGVAILTK